LIEGLLAREVEIGDVAGRVELLGRRGRSACGLDDPVQELEPLLIGLRQVEPRPDLCRHLDHGGGDAQPGGLEFGSRYLPAQGSVEHAQEILDDTEA
jgi:hypothetical protein